MVKLIFPQRAFRQCKLADTLAVSAFGGSFGTMPGLAVPTTICVTELAVDGGQPLTVRTVSSL